MMRWRNEEGWTLIEVLVGFAILSSAVIVSFEVIAGGLRSLAKTKHSMEAMGGMRAAIASLSIAHTVEDIRKLQGENTQERFHVFVEELASRNVQSRLRPVLIRITDVEDAGKNSVPSLETIVIIRQEP